jgi:perosamine synthetase
MFVPVSKPFFDKKEAKYVADALKRKEISGFSGSYIKKFEEAFAKFCGVNYAVAVSSGTTALHLALATLRTKSEDEVLVQSFTNMATFFAVLYQRAKPIPIDSEPRTLNLNPKLIEAKITPKTKAIIVVHIYGHPVDMDPIMEIAQKYKLFVIEDAAEAHGATYKGRKVGSIGDVGCFSFYANKIITTGEGGMITTNSQELADRARMLKSLAFGRENRFMHQDIGYNYRLTNIQAAIGLAQVEKVEKIIRRKRTMAAYYLKALADVEGLILPVEEPHAFNVYWMFNIILGGKLSGKRELVISELKKRGVETREDFTPFNQQKIFIQQGLTKSDDCPVANIAGKDGFYIPSGPDITEMEQKYVVESIKEVISFIE